MVGMFSRRSFGGLTAGALWTAANGAAAGDTGGLGRHPFLLSGEYDHRKPFQTLFLVRDGKLAWSYAIPLNPVNGQSNELGDATLLPNGNVLFAYKTGAGEVTPDHRIVWHIEAPAGAEIHTLQPVGRDHVMVVQNGDPAKLMIIHKASQKVEKTLILPVPNPQKPHIQFRRVRMTNKGTFVAGHLDDKKVVEYDSNGKAIWTYAIDRPWGIDRLKNGNTLISSYNADKLTEVVEVTSGGDIVWRFSQADSPDYKCFQFQGVKRIANGNTLICNWCAGALKDTSQWPGTAQVFEVTPDKRIVWTLSQWRNPDFGTASSIQLLDQPGGYGVAT
ncbi:MAG TPA: hypothetical protein VG839_00320 [Asticcacaulis sp.]|nr:hypothetical protein [Asticcacaulis sp.]